MASVSVSVAVSPAPRSSWVAFGDPESRTFTYHGASPAHEARREGWPPGEVRHHHLDGHTLAEIDVGRRHHLAHAARTEHPIDLEFAREHVAWPGELVGAGCSGAHGAPMKIRRPRGARQLQSLRAGGTQVGLDSDTPQTRP